MLNPSELRLDNIDKVFIAIAAQTAKDNIAPALVQRFKTVPAINPLTGNEKQRKGCSTPSSLTTYCLDTLQYPTHCVECQTSQGQEITIYSAKHARDHFLDHGICLVGKFSYWGPIKTPASNVVPDPDVLYLSDTRDYVANHVAMPFETSASVLSSHAAMLTFLNLTDCAPT